MSGIEGGDVDEVLPRSFYIVRWILYAFIFLLFLGIVWMGIYEAQSVSPGLAALVASGLLWILLDTYPNKIHREMREKK